MRSFVDRHSNELEAIQGDNMFFIKFYKVMNSEEFMKMVGVGDYDVVFL